MRWLNGIMLQFIGSQRAGWLSNWPTTIVLKYRAGQIVKLDWVSSKGDNLVDQRCFSLSGNTHFITATSYPPVSEVTDNQILKRVPTSIFTLHIFLFISFITTTRPLSVLQLNESVLKSWIFLTPYRFHSASYNPWHALGTQLLSEWLNGKVLLLKNLEFEILHSLSLSWIIKYL